MPKPKQAVEKELGKSSQIAQWVSQRASQLKKQKPIQNGEFSSNILLADRLTMRLGAWSAHAVLKVFWRPWICLQNFCRNCILAQPYGRQLFSSSMPWSSCLRYWDAKTVCPYCLSLSLDIRTQNSNLRPTPEYEYSMPLLWEIWTLNGQLFWPSTAACLILPTLLRRNVFSSTASQLQILIYFVNPMEKNLLTGAFVL